MQHRLTVALVLGVWAASSPIQAQSSRPAFVERIAALRSSANLPAVGGATFTSSAVGDIAVSGVRKIGDNAAVTPADLWHIGSLTKTFTSALIGRRVDRGELSFDATLGELLGPERAKKFANATLRNVMSHRAGLRANPLGAEFIAIYQSGDPTPTMRRHVVDLALAAEPLSAPGSTFLYSNLDYILLGSLLEQKAGKAWEDIVREEITTPLRLTTVGFGAPGIASALTQPRGHRGNSGTPLSPVEPGPASDNPPVFGPAGTMHMSIADLARWGQEHLRGERGQDGVVKAATFKQLHAPPDGDYALGWVSQQKSGQRVIWHNGSNTLWYAIVAFNPARDTGIVLVTNGSISAQGALDAFAFDYLATEQR